MPSHVYSLWPNNLQLEIDAKDIIIDQQFIRNATHLSDQQFIHNAIHLSVVYNSEKLETDYLSNKIWLEYDLWNIMKPLKWLEMNM